MLLLLVNIITIALSTQALDAAFAHYDADIQKRSARGGERENGF